MHMQHQCQKGEISAGKEVSWLLNGEGRKGIDTLKLTEEQLQIDGKL